MANPFTGGSASFSAIDYLAPDVAESQRQLARQQAIADLLRQRALEDDNQTQVISGWAIPQSGFKPLEKLANALLVGKMQQGLDAKQAAISQRLAQKLTGQTAGPVDATTLQQAAILDMFSPGAGKALISSKLDQNKPIDAVREADQLFPNDPDARQKYLAAKAAKNVSQSFTPGSVVVGMDGTTSVPMSEYQKQQLQNDQQRLALQGRTTAATEMNANTAARNAGANGGFAGTSMDAQAMNVYSALTLKAQAQPLTPAEQMQLDLATRHLSRPRIGGSAETGFFEIPAAPLPTPNNLVAPSAQPSTPATADPALPASNATLQAPRQLTTPTKPPSADQSKSAGFTSRMENAEKIFTQYPKGVATLQTQALGGVPLVGDLLQRSAQTTDQQLYQQAAEDWVRAKLRKESGAVIGEKEMADEIRTYFPVPGDSPEVVQQKARARAIATEALQKEAGPAYYKSTVNGDVKPASRVNWQDLP